MGKNNRQRRITKHSAAKRRQSHKYTHQRSGGPAAGSSRAAGSPFSGGGTTDPFTRCDAAPSVEQLRREQAERSLNRLLGARASGQLLAHLVEQELISLQSAGLRKLDELVTARLRYVISALWEHGWQPLDLLHVVYKSSPRLAPLSAAVITDQAEAVRAVQRAPQDWLNQLEVVAEEAGGLAAGRDQRTTYLLAAALGRSGLGLVEAWLDIITVARLISELPRLELIAPPPSKWGKLVDLAPFDPVSERGKVLKRIRALLAKAEATNHPAEADTFTAKAQDLVTRHAIDEALLTAAADAAITVVAKRVHLQSPYATTKTSLLNAVATANRCKVIYFDRLAIATVVGVPLDIDQVEMLFTSLLIQATRAMTEAGAAQPGSFDRSATFRRSFLAAYAVRIGERLSEATSAATKSYGNELVPLLRRHEDAVTAEFERLFPFTREVGGRYFDRRGWDAGRRAADRAVFTAGRISA
jgi:Protein of unknown function (DUF2786)